MTVFNYDPRLSLVQRYCQTQVLKLGCQPGTLGCIWGHKYFIFILCYLFLKFLLCWVFVVVHGLSTSCSVRGRLLWWNTGSSVRRLSSYGLQPLELRCIGSIAAAYALSCPALCGILVPWAGIVPISPALEGKFLTSGPPRKSQYFIFK